MLSHFSKIDKKDFLNILLLLFFCVIFHLAELLKSTSILSCSYGDTVGQFFFWREFGFSSLKQGNIPLWNPYVFSGIPFLASPQTALFYPLNLIFLLFSTSTAINISFILHMWLGGLFLYMYLRYVNISKLGSIAGAFTFSFSSIVVCRIYAGHLSKVCTMIWLPLLLLMLDISLKTRRTFYILLTSVLVSIQFLAGHVQYFYYSLITLFAYTIFVCWNSEHSTNKLKEIGLGLGIFISIMVAAVLLSAIQILPSVELVAYSTRKYLPYDFFTRYFFPFENVITLLIPTFFGDVTDSIYWGKWDIWETCLYIGIMPLILISVSLFAASKSRRSIIFFFALSILSMICAFGNDIPAIFSFLYQFVPGFDMFRGISKFVFITAISLSILAGFGLDAIIEKKITKKKIIHILFFWVIIILLASAFYIYITATGSENSTALQKIVRNVSHPPEFCRNPSQANNPNLQKTIYKNISTGIGRLLIFLGISIGIIMCAIFMKINKKTTGVIIFVFILIDLWSFGVRYRTSFKLHKCCFERKVVEFLKKDKSLFRTCTPNFTDLNKGVLYKIGSIGGSGANFLSWYWKFINLSQGYDENFPNLFMTIHRLDRSLNMLNMKYMITYKWVNIEDTSYKKVFSGRDRDIYENLNCMKRAYIVHKAKYLKQDKEILAQVFSAEFNPHDTVILKGKEDTTASSSKGPDKTQILKYAPEEILIKTCTSKRGFLILSDAYYPGWKAYVDNKETKILRANYIFRAIKLPEGTHTIRFVYKPKSFIIGAWISLVSLLLVVIGLLFSYSFNHFQPKLGIFTIRGKD